MAPLNHLLEIRKMWPTNSWHGNVPKAHFLPPILRMTGPLRILLAIIRKGEGGCTCKWMINIKQMNFKMIQRLLAEIKCAMVRRSLAVQNIFLKLFSRIHSPGSQVPRWGGIRRQNPEGTKLSRFSVVICRSKPVTTHVLMFKRSHQRFRSPIVRFFASLQKGGGRKNFFQKFRLLLQSVLIAVFLIKKRGTIHMDFKEFI